MSAPATSIFGAVVPAVTPLLDPYAYTQPVGRWLVDTERWVLEVVKPIMATGDEGRVGVVNAAASILCGVRGGADMIGADDTPLPLVQQWMAEESAYAADDLHPDAYGCDNRGRQYSDHVELTAQYCDRLRELARLLNTTLPAAPIWQEAR